MLPELALRQPRTKRVPEKVEPLVLVSAPAVGILAVDDACLVPIELETDRRHPLGNSSPNLFGPGLRRAVRHCIICIALEGTS
jgi:hypothetical protein